MQVRVASCIPLDDLYPPVHVIVGCHMTFKKIFSNYNLGHHFVQEATILPRCEIWLCRSFGD